MKRFLLCACMAAGLAACAASSPDTSRDQLAADPQFAAMVNAAPYVSGGVISTEHPAALPAVVAVRP